MIYRFVGANSEIGGVAQLDSLGQKVNLSEPAALDAMKGGCAILPDAEYAKLGITPEEEKRFQYAGARAMAPADFAVKLKRGVAVYQKLIDDAAMTEAMGGTPAIATPAPPTPPKKEEVAK